MDTDETQINDRINRCWRVLMRAWMKRWRVVHRDRRESAQAALCLREAVKCRERSRF